MKKFFAILAAAFLVTTMIAPSAAVAAKGGEPRGSGNGRSAAPGQVKKASEGSEVETGEVETLAAPEESSDTPAKNSGNGNGGSAGESTHSAGAHASENGTSTVRVRTHVRLRESEEGSDTAKPARTGIENAFDRISANLDRATTKISEGTRKSLPPGLVRVFEKFLGWLGFESDETPEDEAEIEQPTETPDASDDDTATPAPDSDAVTSTPTPEPEAE